MKLIKKCLLGLLGTLSVLSAKAYDISDGNYYFNYIKCTSTVDVGGVTTYHYNVELTNKEGKVGGSFAQTYSGAIAPPSTFSKSEILSGNSVTYQCTVTRIGDMAFANNASATELTIPETVTEISDLGLLANMELTKITCLATTPPSHSSNYLLVISDVSNNATLYVPQGCKSKYKSASGWSAFKNIVEITPSIGDHDYVDLGLPSGKLWATQNYGASSSTGYGKYVSWSSTDVVTSAWGSYWATPTRTELTELVNKCSWSWNSSKSGYDVVGPNGNSIFLPAAGFQIMGYPQMVGSAIYYWSSTANTYDTGFTYMLQGSSSSVTANTTYNTSITMAPIRPIVKGMVSSVRSLTNTDDVECIGIYDANGRKLDAKQKGVNILRMSDGSTRKIMVR